MRVLLLGAPRPITTNRWKDDAAEAGEALGWQVTHLPARGPSTGDVLRAACGADLFLWMRTHGHVPDGPVGDMLRRIEDAGTPTVGVHLDLYWGIRRREAQIGVDPWWSCQWVFTADGGPRPWRGRGVNHFWCPPPVGARWLYRSPPAARYTHQAVFVGRYVRDVHDQHRRRMLIWAPQHFGAGWRHYGGGPRKQQVWGAELNTLLATTRVVLGDSAPAPCYWSDRVPRTLAAGGLLVYPHTDGLAGQGFDESTMLLYERGRFDQLADAVASLTDARRRELTDNAMTVIAERHLWRHRLERIAEEVFGSWSGTTCITPASATASR